MRQRYRRFVDVEAGTPIRESRRVDVPATAVQLGPCPHDEAALLQRVADDRLRLLRFLYCDPSGVIRGKQVHAARLAGTVQAGLGLTRAQNVVNLLASFAPGLSWTSSAVAPTCTSACAIF